MDSLILPIATALSVTPFDVYVLFGLLVFVIMFLALGIERLYGALFGVVLGIGIYIVLQVLFSPQYQTPETAKLLSEGVVKAIVGTSVYLIFILPVLTPLNAAVAISVPKNAGLKLLETLAVAVGFFAFLLTIVFGFSEKLYIFSFDSAFSLLRSTEFYSSLILPSKTFPLLTGHIQIITIVAILFVIYRLLFSDIVTSLLLSLITSLKKARASGGHGGHEEAFEMHEEHFEEDHHGHH